MTCCSVRVLPPGGFPQGCVGSCCRESTHCAKRCPHCNREGLLLTHGERSSSCENVRTSLLLAAEPGCPAGWVLECKILVRAAACATPRGIPQAWAMAAGRPVGGGEAERTKMGEWIQVGQEEDKCSKMRMCIFKVRPSWPGMEEEMRVCPCMTQQEKPLLQEPLHMQEPQPSYPPGALSMRGTPPPGVSSCVSFYLGHYVDQFPPILSATNCVAFCCSLKKMIIVAH